MLNNGVHQLMNANTTIGIETLSPKQLLGECIDLATCLLKELVTHYLQQNNIKNPFGQVRYANIENRLLRSLQLHTLTSLP